MKIVRKILLKVFLFIILMIITFIIISYVLLQNTYKKMDKMSVPVKMEDLKHNNPEMYNEIIKDMKKSIKNKGE